MEKSWDVAMEVNLNNFEYNYTEIKNIIGENVDIMPIFKDNAYGSYINRNIKFIDKLKIKIIGVAIIDEGIELRELGYKGDILVLNQPLTREISNISKYDLTIGVASVDFLKSLAKIHNDIKIQMEIETGMGRTGIPFNQVQEFIDISKNHKNMKITGIYTHFSSSDSDANYTKSQIDLFNRALNIVQEQIDLKYIHCCNSAGILNFPEARFNLVRPGLILLGYYPNENLINKIDLKPVLKLKSKISFIKTVPAGTFISYDKTFCTRFESKIATIPIGYGDGIRRCLSGKGHVLINNHIVPVIGKICMDCFMADITGINANINDDVYIWDNKNITVDDIAKLYDTINYEVLCTVSERVPRIFVES